MKMTLKEIFGLQEGDVIDFPKKAAPKQTLQQKLTPPKENKFNTFFGDVKTFNKAGLVHPENLKAFCEDVDHVAGQVFDWVEKNTPEKDAAVEKKFHVMITKMEEFFKAFEDFSKESPED